MFKSLFLLSLVFTSNSSFAMSCNLILSGHSKKVLTQQESLALEVYAAAAFAVRRQFAEDIKGMMGQFGAFSMKAEYIEGLPDFRREKLVKSIVSGLMVKNAFDQEIPSQNLLPSKNFRSAYVKLAQKDLLMDFVSNNLVAILINGSYMHSKINWRAFAKNIKDGFGHSMAFSSGFIGAALAPSVLSGAGILEISIQAAVAAASLRFFAPIFATILSKDPKIIPVYNNGEYASAQIYIEHLGAEARAFYTSE